MNLSVALRLGRVSNLPTVWTNVLTGVALGGGEILATRTPVLLLALSLFYVGGMYLNDAFDRGFDARQRPERPIPTGQVRAPTVFAAGFAMLAAGLGSLAWAGYGMAGGTGWHAPAAGLVLAAAIVLYDWRHKDNPFAPVVMGLCRVLVYACSGFAVATVLPPALLAAALALLCYLIGLTYVAAQETLGRIRNLWPLLFLAAPLAYTLPVAGTGVAGVLLYAGLVAWVLFALSFLVRRRAIDVPRAVVSLIAGISLLDAVFIAGGGHEALAWLAVAGFALTLFLQRFVPGT